MIVNEKIKIKVSNKVLKHYKKYYKDIKSGDEIEIFPIQLLLGSNKKIKVKCDNCNNEKHVVYCDYNKTTNNNTSIYYCSKCRGIAIKEGTKRIYGVDNVFQLESIKKKLKETCKERYGVEHHLQNETILNKQRKTNQERYGVNHIPELKRHTQEKFINMCVNIHGKLYDYSKVIYRTVEEHVEIICNKHGSFFQIGREHLKGQGCPKCKTSKGENEIIKYLDNKGIEYIHQKKFKDCIHKTQLPFDFYIPKLNMCIEYDGIQHNEMVEYFGGEKAYILRKKKDKIKNVYCKEKGILLERITHSDNIPDRLDIIL